MQQQHNTACFAVALQAYRQLKVRLEGLQVDFMHHTERVCQPEVQGLGAVDVV